MVFLLYTWQPKSGYGSLNEVVVLGARFVFVCTVLTAVKPLR